MPLKHSTEYEGFISNITQALRHNADAYTIESLSSSFIDEARGRENNPQSQKLLYTKGKGSNKSYKNVSQGKFCTNCQLPSI